MFRQFAIPALMLMLVITSVTFAADIPEPQFKPQTIDPRIKIGYGCAIGDVDGDGKADILLADQKQFAWYKNPGKAGAGWKKYVMVENLTSRDNVCIAARDINGDGKVEVAVGAQWNPGETNDRKKSGSVHYLKRPADPTQKWTPIKLPHDPTVHRMHWVKAGQNNFHLLVLPLHGVGNRGGAGKSVRIGVHIPPKTAGGKWGHSQIDTGMHATHNFDVMVIPTPDGKAAEGVLVAGKEGLRGALFENGGWQKGLRPNKMFTDASGEVRAGSLDPSGRMYVAAIQPMHGSNVVVYHGRNEARKVVLDSSYRHGHALQCRDFLGLGRPQVVAGWRFPNSDKRVGIRMYVPTNRKASKWKTIIIDDNNMACEDLQSADLDGDGRRDLIAAGRATNNLVIYWNKTKIKRKLK